MRLVITVSLMLALVLATAFSANAYYFVNLGSGTSTGVANDGSAVAWHGSGNINLWTRGAWSSSAIGAGTSAGVAVQSGGYVVGGNCSGNTTPSYYQGGTWTNVAAPGGYTSWTANGIGASGSDIYIAGENLYNTNYHGAVGWSLGGGTFKFDHNAYGPGHDNSYARAVSDNGVYVGEAQFSGDAPGGGSRMGVYGGPNPAGADWNWFKTAISPYTPNYNEEVQVFAVSGDGTKAAGWAYAPSGAWQAVYWTANPTLGSMQAYLIPLLAMDWSESHAISNNGVVGGWNYMDGGYSVKHAFMWSSALGTKDLNTYLPTLGINLGGMVLDNVTGISDDGKILTGTGTLGGVQKAWVANISVPEPSSLIALAVGLVGLITRRRRA